MFAVKVELDAYIDGDYLEKVVERAKMSTLFRVGSGVRRVSRKSIRRRKKPSKPGQPPHAHARARQTVKHILYGVDKPRMAVLIGPVRFPSSRSKAPRVLERGGVVINEYKSDTGFIYARRRVKVKPRPYMFPALEEVAAEAPAILAEELRKKNTRAARTSTTARMRMLL